MNVATISQSTRIYKPKSIQVSSEKSLVESLIKKVEGRYGYSVDRLKQKDKHRDLVVARQAVVFLLKTHTLLELSAIGKILNLHFSSVSVGYKRILEQIEVRDRIALEIKELSDSVGK